MQHLFTYGTLGPNQSCEHLLGHGSWQKAYVYGKRLPDGWDFKNGYPGIVLTNGPEKIEGHVFSSTQIQHHWPRIDEYEGDLYRRVLVTCYLETGKTQEAYIYEAIA